MCYRIVHHGSRHTDTSGPANGVLRPGVGRKGTGEKGKRGGESYAKLLPDQIAEAVLDLRMSGYWSLPSILWVGIDVVALAVPSEIAA